MKLIKSIDELAIESDEFSIGITVPQLEDYVAVQFHGVGDENKQHLFINYLHPKLVSIKQNIPNCDIECSITVSTDVVVTFKHLGDYKNRLKFEQFLYKWLPKNIV
jgi:hypothetical protein